MNVNPSIVLTLVMGALLFTILAFVIILSLVQYKRRQVQYRLEQANLRHAFENQLLHARLETQEKSFQFLSEEIHDNIGQTLSVVGMYLYQLQETQSSENQQRFATLGSELLNKAINDLRSLSHTMNAQYVAKNNLADVLRQELEYINSAKGAQCRLDVQGEPEDLPADRQTLLFRIIQEGINNALKHAQAEHIIVGLKYEDGRLMTSIQDDGRGMPDTHFDRLHTGLGFTNMQLRAKLLGGKLFVESKPRQGTRLWLNITINPA